MLSLHNTPLKIYMASFFKIFNLLMQSEEQKQKSDSLQVLKIQQLKAIWNSFAPMYSRFDAAFHTFYYTLINMIDISKAHNVLEIACGTGKLLPLAVNMKTINCKYLASDLSQTMVNLCKFNLKSYLEKMGVQEPLQSWMKRNNIKIKIENGQQKIETQEQFDRIICNLVIMLTQNPIKMMQNLHSLASEECLMGVTIWGNEKLSNFLTLYDKALQQWGLPKSKIRNNFHLYNHLSELAAQTGWQIVVQWQQIVPYNHYQLDEMLLSFVKDWCKYDEKMIDYHINKILQTFQCKETLNYPVQMAVLRKK